MKCLVMPSQTVGPFPHPAWRWAVEANPKAASASTIEISGTVTDGAGQPMDDAWLEFWSPEAARAEANLDTASPGFRRAPTDAKGSYRIAFPAPLAEPAIYVTIFSRGILTHLYTAVFVEDAPGLQQSELLGQVPSGRRATLLARKEGERAYRWDVRLQGDQETVFFDYA